MDESAANQSTCHLSTSLLMCFLIGCGTQTASEKELGLETPTLQTVATLQIAEPQNERRTIVFYGKLIAEKSAAMRFSIAGNVDRVEAAIGDRKKQGEILAVIAQPELSAEKTKLDLQVQQLRSRVAQSPQSQQARIQQQIEGLQAQQKQLDAQLASGILIAPFDCIVRNVRVEAKKSASPVIAALDVVADRTPIVVGQLPENTLQQLPPEQTIWVAIVDKAFKCKIRQPTVDVDNVVMEFAEPLPPDYWLFDDVVEARFILETKSEGYWLPIGALRRDAVGHWNMLATQTDVPNVLEGVLLEARRVNVKRTKADSVLVDGAIHVGDLIVGSGGHRVVAGQRVVVNPVSDDVVVPAGADL